ncbi:MAG: hypothetical protein KAY24_15145 [Candidatus Eisenbacteria sp.]|nr:hypothetical protein [Candidatus Eisenbacteria bacterium]
MDPAVNRCKDRAVTMVGRDAMGALSRLAGCVLLGAIALLGAALPSAAQTTGSSAWLSWRADERLAEIPWPGTGREGALPLYFTVELDQPIDSLGFNLHWATGEPGGRVEVRAVRSSAQAPSVWHYQPHDGEAHAGNYRALGTWLSDRGFLAQIATSTPEGRVRYDLVLDLVISGARSLRIEASRITVAMSNGEVQRLGNSAVSMDGGWARQVAPLITRISGVLNRTYIQSVLSVYGENLDRLVRFVLIDEEGKRFYPVDVRSHSRERVDLVFVTKELTPGWIDVEIGAPDGNLDTLRSAVLDAALEYHQPGDTNLGIIPGSDE